MSTVAHFWVRRNISKPPSCILQVQWYPHTAAYFLTWQIKMMVKMLVLCIKWGPPSWIICKTACGTRLDGCKIKVVWMEKMMGLQEKEIINNPRPCFMGLEVYGCIFFLDKSIVGQSYNEGRIGHEAQSMVKGLWIHEKIFHSIMLINKQHFVSFKSTIKCNTAKLSQNIILWPPTLKHRWKLHCLDVSPQSVGLEGIPVFRHQGSPEQNLKRQCSSGLSPSGAQQLYECPSPSA